jgi:hypothetical protein
MGINNVHDTHHAFDFYVNINLKPDLQKLLSIFQKENQYEK